MAGRPAKALVAKTGTILKDEENIRRAAEEAIRGNGENVEPPKHLNAAEKKVFRYIRDHLASADLVGGLDIYMIAETAVTIVKIAEIDKKLHKRDMSVTEQKSLITSRSTLMKDFFRGCSELSMSPQARAKISIAAVQAVEAKSKKDPLLEALNGD